MRRFCRFFCEMAIVFELLVLFDGKLPPLAVRG
jgi:hypothetical protein